MGSTKWKLGLIISGFLYRWNIIFYGQQKVGSWLLFYLDFYIAIKVLLTNPPFTDRGCGRPAVGFGLMSESLPWNSDLSCLITALKAGLLDLIWVEDVTNMVMLQLVGLSQSQTWCGRKKYIQM